MRSGLGLLRFDSLGRLSGAGILCYDTCPSCLSGPTNTIMPLAHDQLIRAVL